MFILSMDSAQDHLLNASQPISYQSLGVHVWTLGAE